MGHNVSNSTLRKAISGRLFADFLDWRFLISCPRCREERVVPARVLSERVGGGAMVEQVVSRLKCSMPQCGATPSAVVMMDRKRRVALVGPGAYD